MQSRIIRTRKYVHYHIGEPRLLSNQRRQKDFGWYWLVALHTMLLHSEYLQWLNNFLRLSFILILTYSFFIFSMHILRNATNSFHLFAQSHFSISNMFSVNAQLQLQTYVFICSKYTQFNIVLVKRWKFHYKAHPCASFSSWNLDIQIDMTHGVGTYTYLYTSSLSAFSILFLSFQVLTI